MRIHFIAIGGAAMHNLAIALHKSGNIVSGSDDEIYEPSKSRLNKHGLLPKEIGWHTSRIHRDLDAIILGMHAKLDNPELIEAQRQGLKIFSFPSFIAQKSRYKKRVVVAGSHGKTTTTAIIMHALKVNNIEFDYLVGSIIDGFDTMAKLSDAPLIILEGDEYLSSPIDRRPKMLHYKPHISIITGIAWDHVNVFPTFEEYIKQFDLFIQSHEENAVTYVYSEDYESSKLAKQHTSLIKYDGVELDENKNVLFNEMKYPVHLIGYHNMQNIRAAWLVCKKIGLSDTQFLSSLDSFHGTQKRMQLISKTDRQRIYLDFAHSPSKVEATVRGVRDWFPDSKIYVFYELHTYSSFQSEFLPHYKHSMDPADESYVLYNKKTLEIKRRTPPKDEDIRSSFGINDLKVLKSKDEVSQIFETIKSKGDGIILIMTSGNFFGLLD